MQPPSAQQIEKQGWTYASKPSQLARGAHEPQSEITGLAFAQDDAMMVSRGMDGAVKVWDLRALRSPVKIFTGLPARYASANVALSPDERLILVGTAAADGGAGGGDGEGEGGGGGGGRVVFIDRRELKIVRALGVPGHATAVRWHDRINQVFVGVGERRVSTAVESEGRRAGGGPLNAMWTAQQRIAIAATRSAQQNATIATATNRNQLTTNATTNKQHQTGGRRAGGVRVLYDPGLSERGALLPVARAPRAASALDFAAAPLAIHVPGAASFRDAARGKKRAAEPEKRVRLARRRRRRRRRFVVCFLWRRLEAGAGGLLGTRCVG